MTPMKEKPIYRVSFYHEKRAIELYVRSVSQSSILGFIKLEDIIFSEQSSLVIVPKEEALKKEFEKTKRTFIPLHSIIRIDEMKGGSSTQAKSRLVSLKKDGDKKRWKDPEGKNGHQISPIYSPPTNPAK